MLGLGCARASTGLVRLFTGLCVALMASTAARGGAVRIGDPGSVFDPSKYDDRFPSSLEWAKAGVEGGIPFRSVTPAVARVKPGEDIQAAIDRAKRGVVLVAPGVHRVTQLISLRSGVILRGEDRDESIIEYDIGTSQRDHLGRCFMLRKIERAGIEDLTFRHARVFAMDFERYRERYENFPGFSPGDNATIEIVGSSNCWVQNCRNLCSVSRPLRIHGGSSHVTFRDNVTDKALNKGGGGQGYYEVVGGTYVLFYNETVSNIRHFCLDATIDYTVLVHCNLSVDINWHCIRPMANALVESVTSRLHPGHMWPPLAHYRDPAGEGNHIYRFDCSWKRGAEMYKGVPCDPESVYLLRPSWDEEPWVYRFDGPPPKAGTLYPVTGVHAPPRDPKEDTPQAVLRPEAKEKPQAKKPARPPRKRPRDGAVAAWDARLLERVKAELAAGRRPRFSYGSMGRASVVACDDRDSVTISARGLEFRTALSKLSLKDRKGLAVAVLREREPRDQCVVAFYLLASGDERAAEERLRRAGALAHEVRDSFEVAAGDD